MPKVVPSQVVALIDQVFPGVKTTPNFPVYSGNAATLSAIVSLTNDIPEELITISGEDYSDLVHGLEALAHSVDGWNQLGGDKPPNLIKGKSPVVIVWEMLRKCPDQNPSPATAEMEFISDTELRESVRMDLSTATSGLHNGEWKASTVLAGRVVEALLLWAIQRDPTLLGSLAKKPKRTPEDWKLFELIDVAEELQLIETSTASQARLAKDFRNLIHPGRALRTQEVCDRATALTALAAAELVVRDLS